MATGIEVRTAKDGTKSYRASVWSNRDDKRIRKTFPSMAAAKSWRRDAQVALGQGRLRAPEPTTLRQAADEWLSGVRAGAIRNRSGEVYKPSAIRSYDVSLRLRVLPQFGSTRLSDIHHSDLQRFAEQLVGEGLSASTVHGAFLPLRAIFRREVAQGRLAVNPTTGLQLPVVRSHRDRIADPQEAAKLIDALPRPEDQALWATAFYGGLRLGELQALDWGSVDLAGGVIRVTRSWDQVEGYIDPKSAQGRRRVPIAGALRAYLVKHRLRQGRSQGLVFGRTATRPFCTTTITKRSFKTWEKAGLERITLHEARHSYASVMIAAGCNAKQISSYMGHANISITYDVYGHLLAGSESVAAGMLDAYLERAQKPLAAGETA